MKVKALQTVKVGGVHRVPGTESATFDWQPRFGSVEEAVRRGLVERVEKTRPKKSEPKGEGGEPPSELPEDVPARAELAVAGITSLEQLSEVEDLVSIPGIGEATAKRIREYLDS